MVKFAMLTVKTPRINIFFGGLDCRRKDKSPHSEKKKFWISLVSIAFHLKNIMYDENIFFSFQKYKKKLLTFY